MCALWCHDRQLISGRGVSMKKLNARATTIFLELIDGLGAAGAAKKVDNTHGSYMAVHVDCLRFEPDRATYAVAHRFESNGDLCSDPDVEFYVAPDPMNLDQKAVYPTAIDQQLGGYRRAVEFDDAGKPTGVRNRAQVDLVAFCNMWLKNIGIQQRLPTPVRRQGRAWENIPSYQPGESERAVLPKGKRLGNASDVWTATQDIHSATQEHAIVFDLDVRHRVIARRVIGIGSICGVDVHPREVFRQAIANGAAAVIMAHNHPSGDYSPSRQDIDLTTRMQEVGGLCGIPLLDHVVVSVNGYCSICNDSVRAGL